MCELNLCNANKCGIQKRSPLSRSGHQLGAAMRDPNGCTEPPHLACRSPSALPGNGGYIRMLLRWQQQLL